LSYIQTELDTRFIYKHPEVELEQDMVQIEGINDYLEAIIPQSIEPALIMDQFDLWARVGQRAYMFAELQVCLDSSSELAKLQVNRILTSYGKHVELRKEFCLKVANRLDEMKEILREDRYRQLIRLIDRDESLYLSFGRPEAQKRGAYTKAHAGLTLSGERAMDRFKRISFFDPSTELTLFKELGELEGIKSHVGHFFTMLVSTQRYFNEQWLASSHHIHVDSFLEDYYGIEWGSIRRTMSFCKELQWLNASLVQMKADALELRIPMTYEQSRMALPGHRTYEWDEVTSRVRRYIAELGHEVVTEACEEIFTDHRICYQSHPNKMTGAASNHSERGAYVIMNPRGDFKDIALLAHELGHVAEYRVCDDHGVSYLESEMGTLRVELTSTFFQTIATMKAFDEATNVAEKFEILSSLIYAMTNVVGPTRINSLIAAAQQDDMPLHVDDICEEYLEGLQVQDSHIVVQDPGRAYEWIFRHHMFTKPWSLWVYGYNTIISLLLWEKLKANPNYIFIYMDVVEQGGEISFQETLEGLDIDITDDTFGRAMQILENMFKELDVPVLV